MHAVAVPWIARNFRGTHHRSRPSSLSPGVHVAGGIPRRGGQVSVSAGARGGRSTAVRRVPPAVRPWSTEAPPAGELLVSFPFSFSRPCLWYVMSDGLMGGWVVSKN
jgi:hypothetical protein